VIGQLQAVVFRIPEKEDDWFKVIPGNAVILMGVLSLFSLPRQWPSQDELLCIHQKQAECQRFVDRLENMQS
jgi:hypothetical protein